MDAYCRVTQLNVFVERTPRMEITGIEQASNMPRVIPLSRLSILSHFPLIVEYLRYLLRVLSADTATDTSRIVNKLHSSNGWEYWLSIMRVVNAMTRANLSQNLHILYKRLSGDNGILNVKPG